MRTYAIPQMSVTTDYSLQLLELSHKQSKGENDAC